MRLLVSAMLACFALAACEAPQTQIAASTAISDGGSRGNANGSGSIRFLGGDGSSLAKAILISGARGEIDGVQSEYDWIAKFRPGWKVVGQALLTNGPRQYDVLHITKGGQKADIYFDITEYFGKF